MTDLVSRLEGATEGSRELDRLSLQWRPIEGYWNLYDVCADGRVRSTKGRHGRGQILNPSLPADSRQYKSVSLHKDGKRERALVHRLVAVAFLGPPPFPGAQVRHLDGERGNNRATNLAWGTARENAADRKKHGKGHSGERHPCAKLSEEDVSAIRGGEEGTAVLAERYGVHRTTIQRIRSGKRWAHNLTALPTGALRARETG